MWRDGRSNRWETNSLHPATRAAAEVMRFITVCAIGTVDIQ